MANLGGPFARAIGNQIFGLFQPSLSDAANYLADTPRFRDTVAVSFVLSYAFAFASLGVLVLLPDQKAEAQRRKRTWPQRPRYAVLTLVLMTLIVLDAADDDVAQTIDDDDDDDDDAARLATVTSYLRTRSTQRRSAHSVSGSTSRAARREC